MGVQVSLGTDVAEGSDRHRVLGAQRARALQDTIDERLPDASKLELFGRRPRAGWTVWGNDTERLAEWGR